MSKMDAMRAMREARYQDRRASAPPRAATKAAPRLSVAADTPVDADVPAVPEVALCGHRAISGRTCTREQGHSAKSHRYS
jgi:hypothetical protein